ncbi:unnamed protein product, partial [Leptidea sinapis]
MQLKNQSIGYYVQCFGDGKGLLITLSLQRKIILIKKDYYEFRFKSARVCCMEIFYYNLYILIINETKFYIGLTTIIIGDAQLSCDSAMPLTTYLLHLLAFYKN